MSGEMENLRVVLVATRNPLNIGAAARAMSNFGALRLRVVAPYEKAWREAKSAVGAGGVLKEAEEFASVREAVADCTLVVGTTAVGNRELQHPLRGLGEAGPLMRKGLKKGRVALLFGSEKWGLSNESLSYCHWLLRIPTREEHRSMNLGQSVAVCLYEVIRGVKKAPVAGKAEPARSGRRGQEARRAKLRAETEGPAKMETVERIEEAWLRALQKSGYVGKRGEALAGGKLRRMLRRFSFSEADAEVFLGMVRKVLRSLQNPEEMER